MFTMSEPRRNVQQSSWMGLLPLDMLYEILLRLRVKTLSRLLRVCKPWNSLISHPDFQKEHYRRGSQQNPLFLVPKHGFDNDGFATALNFSTHTAEGETLTKFSKSILKSLTLYGQTQSCLGIVCIANEEKILLCNPTREELILLPPSPGVGFGFSQRVGIGYSASSKQFKVVRFYKRYLNDPMLRFARGCEVLVLGSSDGWREATSPPFYPRLGTPLLHGALHLLPDWKMGEKGFNYIATFDIDTEEYTNILLPETFSDGRHEHAKISELSGSLCLTRDFRGSEQTAEIWILTDYYSSRRWVKQYSIDLSAFTASHVYATPTPLAISGDGSLLLQLDSRGKCDKRYTSELAWYNSQQIRSVQMLYCSTKVVDYICTTPYVEGFFTLQSFSEHFDSKCDYDILVPRVVKLPW